MSDGNEITGQEPAEVTERSVAEWLTGRLSARGSHHALVVHDGKRWRAALADEFLHDVRELAAGLIGVGMHRGDRVVVMAPTSASWTRLDLAVMVAGGVTVPLYESSSDSHCRVVFERVGARFGFASNDDVIERLRALAPDDLRMWRLDEETLDELASGAGDEHRDELNRRDLTPDSIATIVFTSGTTGDPKGVPLTHHQLVWTARQTAKQLEGALGPDQTTLLFLPLAHIFARVVVFAALESGVELAYGRSIDHVPDDLRSYRPTFLLAVPRMLERVISGARGQATGWKRPVFDWAMTTARKWSEADRPGPLLRLEHRLADRLVLSALREGLGGRVRYAVSGGARLDPALGHTIAGAGLTVLEGYGLTETTAPVSVNRPEDLRIGTVGPPLPGLTVRISDDGEILVKGPSVTDGYLADDPSAPDDVVRPDDDFAGDWFRTGDRGRITDDGHLVITGRAKELIVTDGGEAVAPVTAEDALTGHPAIAQAMVLGNDRPFVSALVVLDDEAPDDPDEQRRVVESAVESANEELSEGKIREFRIVEREFTEDDEELTPTMKLRRDKILEHFADDVEALYERDDAS
jgi:long-chain acyl-CoA synthetase